MPGMEEFSTAMANRSIRTIKAELEFLADSSFLTSAQLSTILSNLPAESSGLGVERNVSLPPTNGVANLSVSNGTSEKKQKTSYYDDDDEKTNGYTAPPPAYPAATTPAPPPVPTTLTYATSLYAYNPTDAGDLALQANDRVAVTEYMNAEWWKGRNERTGLEGIFPRSYVRVDDKLPPAQKQETPYGNMPLDIASGNSGQAGPSDPSKPSKGSEAGKKFGKKLGNAAIFGAGATIGSNIVNGIF